MQTQSLKTVRDYIRTIVDFPHEGILFRDVTTLFADPRGFRMCIDQLLAPYAGMRIDKVVGLEARGFILGGAVAHQLSTGFVPIRKKGKLPGQTISQAYTLEYGEAVVEVHEDALSPGEKVLLVDDLLATGGTAEAGIKLIERLGAQVIGCAFVVDLPDLGGMERLLAMGMEVHRQPFRNESALSMSLFGLPSRTSRCLQHVRTSHPSVPSGNRRDVLHSGCTVRAGRPPIHRRRQ